MELSSDAVAVIGFVVLFALMLLRVPVGMAMGLVGVSGFGYLVGGTPALKMVGQTSMRTVTDYTFGVIPMFLLMGAFVSRSGMSRELFQAANRFVGHLRGGLGIATIAACAGFAAISGSSVATAATFSTVAYPEMRLHHYPQSFSTGVIAAGGTLGAMFPPSIVLAVYGLITQQDIGKLFMAGILPGLLAVCMYMATIAVIGAVRPGYLPAAPRSSWRERARGHARRLGAAAAVRVRHRRTVRRAVHADRGRRRRRGRRVPDQRRARPAVARGHSGLAAAGHAHRGRGVHHPDRRHPVRLLPDGDADAAEGDRVRHRPRLRPLRRAGADHADVSRPRLPDGRDGDDHPDDTDHLSGHHHAGLRSRLVRRDHRDDGGTWADPSAGRDERVRHQDRGEGRRLLHDLLRRHPVRHHRHHTAGDPHRVSRTGTVPAEAICSGSREAKPTRQSPSSCARAVS